MAKARQLNPDPPAWYAIGEGLAQFSKRDFAASLAAFDKAPDYVTRYLFSAVALEQLGRISEARAMADHLNAKYPGFRPSYYVYQEAMDMGANGALLIESAARLGIPAVVSPPANVAASSDRKP
jgi:tetratricopeptide (TPR) repeat protein